jgi:hypothetical protein
MVGAEGTSSGFGNSGERRRAGVYILYACDVLLRIPEASDLNTMGLEEECNVDTLFEQY